MDFDTRFKVCDLRNASKTFQSYMDGDWDLAFPDPGSGAPAPKTYIFESLQ